MGDYGRELQFGISVEPTAESPGWAESLAKTADRMGLELVGFQDHPYQRRFHDTWTHAVGRRTRRTQGVCSTLAGAGWVAAGRCAHWSPGVAR